MNNGSIEAVDGIEERIGRMKSKVREAKERAKEAYRKMIFDVIFDGKFPSSDEVFEHVILAADKSFDNFKEDVNKVKRRIEAVDRLQGREADFNAIDEQRQSYIDEQTKLNEEAGPLEKRLSEINTRLGFLNGEIPSISMTRNQLMAEAKRIIGDTGAAWSEDDPDIAKRVDFFGEYPKVNAPFAR